MSLLPLSTPALYGVGESLTSPGGSFTFVVQGPICRLYLAPAGWRLDPVVQRHASYAVLLLLPASEGYRGRTHCDLTLFWEPPLSVAEQLWWYRQVAVVSDHPVQSNTHLPAWFTASPTQLA